MTTQNQTTSPFQVFVRWRPLPSDEPTPPKLQHDITQQDSTYAISISSPNSSGRLETWKSGAAFTHVFTATDDNRDVFERVVAPSLPQVLNGATCNFFAYGHSGSGKTHTIIGYEYEDTSRLGLCLTAAREIFHALDTINSTAMTSQDEAARSGQDEEELCVAVRLYEVRGKFAYDLLNDNGVECHVRVGS